MSERNKERQASQVFYAAAFIVLAAGALGALVAGRTAHADEPELYSIAQAKLGAATYTDKCLKCHTAEGMAPVLKGDSFWPEWDGKPARALYSRILSTMPADDPGSIPEKDVINLVAYIMEMNGLQGGTKDIQTPEELNKILMQRGK